MTSQQFCLKWNNHQANMVTVFDDLFSNQDYVDVTLACEGSNIKAHKMVLSACSPFFQDVFKNNPCQHPIVILKDMRYEDLKAIVRFMYKGEVNVSQDQLNALLKTAESLQIKGLAEVANENSNDATNEQRSENIAQESSDKLSHMHQSSHHLSPPMKRRRNRISRPMSSPLQHSSSVNESQSQINNITSQHLNSSIQGLSSSDSQTLMPSIDYSDINVKTETDDEPEVIPIPIKQEINRGKSLPDEQNVSNNTSMEASYSMLDQGDNNLDSSQNYYQGDTAYDSQFPGTSDQTPQNEDSTAGSVQYSDDFSVGYVDGNNTSTVPDELSSGPNNMSSEMQNPDSNRTSGGQDCNSFFCSLCHQVFFTEDTYSKHIKKCKSSRSSQYRCHICTRVYKTKYTLSRHIKVDHSCQRVCHRCPFCPSVFKWNHDRKNHIKNVHHSKADGI